MVIGAGVGTVVCLEVPVGSEFGVDYEAFRTAEKFRGVKLIPSGLHFVFYASNGEHDNGNGIRQGFFVEIKPNDVVIRTWSSDTEELVPMTREADVENLTRAVHGFQLDGNLGAYPQKHAKTWRRLSKYITKEVLAQCGLTVGGTISPGDPDALSLESNDLTTLKPFFPDVAQVARFTPLKKPSTAQRSAGDLTLYHVDSRYALVSNDPARPTHLSEHLEWLLSTHFHNDWVGADFFQDEIAHDNFIKTSLASLFEILHDDTLDAKVCPIPMEDQQVVRASGQRFQLQFDVMGTYAFGGDDDSAPTVLLPDEVRYNDAITFACTRLMALWLL
ncbi:hypothetical protein DYB36_001551 [Aphanomyces astaci]|uniref:AAR2 N-terminal domain-containing protein n=1 Tax=Aphanomyces astaci TaxID=112090 RepID=A0A397APR3_APHAT|nr:hypothetical protein DYB36_001551 [Aphanomyces astaci]